MPTVKFSRHKEVTLNGVVCFIKINCIDINTCLHNLLQRMICGEDNARLTRCASGIVEQLNHAGFGGAEEISITTVNVHYMQLIVGNQLKELLTKLLGKENTRSNNNDSASTILIQIILNHANSFAATGRDDDLSFVVLQHCVNRSLLMWAKGDGQVGVLFSME